MPNQMAGSWNRCVGSNDAVYFAGHVKYIVDRVKNTTMTTTIYAGKVTYTINNRVTTAEASDVMSNGSFKYSRTDINEAGTVFAVDYDYINTQQHEMYVHTSRPAFKTLCLILNDMQSISNRGEGLSQQ
jgi:hypothetical protein